MSEDTLVLVHTIFRHGERTTDWEFMYPNDPYNKEEFLPYGPGQLTNVGKQEMYDLGKTIRSMYDRHLGELYLPKYVDARSSNFDRAKASLQLVLASLYPPTGDTVWNEEVKWQPIPYNSFTFEDDEILATVFGSRDFLKSYEEHFEKEGKKVLEGYEELLTYLRENAGGDFKTTRSAWFLHATLSTERQNNLELPKWTSLVFPEQTAKLTFHEYAMQTATKKLKRLVVGGLMKKILNDTIAKINGNSDCKIHLYSCHDNNIATSLIFFGLLPPNHFAKYAACVILEVHKINSKHVIKLRYRPSKSSDLKYLIFSHGQDCLNVEDFENMVQDVFKEETP